MSREVGQLYKGPMVRAIIKGAKTNTRRPLALPKGCRWTDMDAGLFMTPHGVAHVNLLKPQRRYAQPGDTIWVRETHAHSIHAMASASDDAGPWVYAADGEAALQQRLGHQWTPAIHMKRVACRLLLACTEVRIERLLSITEADALAEGIEPYRGPLRWVRHLDAITGEPIHLTARDAYLALWDHINGDGAAALNPWVRSTYFKIKELRK